MARSPQEKADKVRSKQAQMMAGLGAGIGGGKVSGGTAKGAADAGKAHKMAGPSTYWGSTELGVLVMLLALAVVEAVVMEVATVRVMVMETMVVVSGVQEW